MHRKTLQTWRWVGPPRHALLGDFVTRSLYLTLWYWGFQMMMMEVRCSVVLYQVSRLVSSSVGRQDLLWNSLYYVYCIYYTYLKRWSDDLMGYWLSDRGMLTQNCDCSNSKTIHTVVPIHATYSFSFSHTFTLQLLALSSLSILTIPPNFSFHLANTPSFYHLLLHPIPVPITLINITSYNSGSLLLI